MNILVTGAKGFIGKNLIATLNNIRDGKDKSFKINPNFNIFEYDVDTNPELLELYCKEADFVYHLAGVNRPEKTEDFMRGNFGFSEDLLYRLEKYDNTCPVMLSSSIQAELDNPYGKSKRAGEDLFFRHGMKTGAKVYVYRFTNVFGKWCRPNYNSVIATFCHNITHGLPIQVNDPSVNLNLVYIDDVIEELLRALSGYPSYSDRKFCFVPVTYSVNLGMIAELLYSFHDSRQNKSIPDMTGEGFIKKLYSTYLSYLPENEFSYPLKMNIDERGSFTEFIRTQDRGQISVNIVKPGVTKGNHWHHSKNEKFVAVSGKALIQFRRIDSEHVIEYHVSGDRLEVVDIPVGYTHNIINEGSADLVTIMWCNECFNPEKPDTYYLKVEGDVHG